MTERPAILFDLGGVLIDWNPRHFYRTVFEDEAAMEHFLATVCTAEWNHAIDAGRPFEEAVRELQAARPDCAEFIGFWQTRWADMLKGPVAGTVEVLRDLKAQGLTLCALTNWSAETFPLAQERYDFLSWFSRIVVSGAVGLAKPDPAIFRLALKECGLVAARTLFIDDVLVNVETARSLGMEAIHFLDPGQLRGDLVKRGLLP
jgi:2-haloacid dehalogenase